MAAGASGERERRSAAMLNPLNPDEKETVPTPDLLDVRRKSVDGDCMNKTSALQSSEMEALIGDSRCRKSESSTGENAGVCHSEIETKNIKQDELLNESQLVLVQSSDGGTSHVKVPRSSSQDGDADGKENLGIAKVDGSKSGEIFVDQNELKEKLQLLLHILETSQDADEKKATLKQISCLAEAMKDVISFELDDEDGDSLDGHSSPEPLLDIPLPEKPIAKSSGSSTETGRDVTGIPLPGSGPERLKSTQRTMFFDEDSSDMPPLPPLPQIFESDVVSSGRELSKGSASIRKDVNGRAMNEEKSQDDTDNSRDDNDDQALQTHTSLGPVTLHVNKKLVPRLSRASVFDLNDENAKEIGRKLQRLKKLKKLRRSEENTEHKIEAKERILMWKEELLGSSRLLLQCNLSLPANAPPSLPNNMENQSADNAVDAANLTVTVDHVEPSHTNSDRLSVNLVSKENVSKNLPSECTESSANPPHFVKVCSKNGQKELNWPVEMVRSTKLLPELCFSCNPLEFDFGITGSSETAGDLAKLESKAKRKKKKKSREYVSNKKSSDGINSKEVQKMKENADDSLHFVSSRSGLQSGHRSRKQPVTLSSPCDLSQPRGQSSAKDSHKSKSNQSDSKKKQLSDTSSATVVKNRHNETNSKDHKRSLIAKKSGERSSRLSDSNKEKLNDAEKPTCSKVEQHLRPDNERKRKLSAGEVQSSSKRINVSTVSKSVEGHQKEVDDRISDFDDMGLTGGPGKWDTSSDSELEASSAGQYPDAKALQVRASGKHEQKDQRRRQSFTSSDIESSSSQDYSDSDDRSHRSHSRSRSYSSYSYYSSPRSRSYSSDSDYRQRHSRSSSSRSHSRRRRSYSYSDDSYHSKSRSYSRGRRGRSRSCSRGGRFRSYSSYSRSSRSYSRSRSRSKSRSHRRYSRSRSNYKDRYHSRSQKTKRENHTQSKMNKCDPLISLKSKSESNKTKKSEAVSSSVKSTDTKTGKKNKDVCTDVTKRTDDLQPSSNETTAEKNISQNISCVDDDLKISEIPRPEDSVVVSIPLPTVDSTRQADGLNSTAACSTKKSSLTDTSSMPPFIGPTLPVNHPLAHVQDIPVPKNEQFQPIGPNDPLVFKTPLHPPPPPPSFLTETGSKFVGRDPPLPPRPKSPPPLPNDWAAMEDIAGNEEPIPHMLDLGAIKPAMIIPPEQAEQYKALQHQAQLHARQRMREEAGIPDEEEEEEEEETNDEEIQRQQLIEEALIERAQNAAFMAAQPVIHLQQPQLVAPTLGGATSQVVLGNTGFFQVPMSMQMVSTGHAHGLVSLAPSMVPVLPQAGAPMVIAAHSGAMSALIRAHEAQVQAQAQAEAAEEAEAQAKAQAQASMLQSQSHEWLQIVQMPGSGRAVAVPAHAFSSSVPHAIAMSGLRPAGIQMHHGLIPVQSMNHPSLHQSALVQQFPLGLSMRVGLPSGVIGPQQILTGSPQSQGVPLLIDSSGNILVPRLLRPGHL